MERRNLVLMVALVFCLSLVVVAQLPQSPPPAQPAQPQVDQDRIEAAHGKLLSGEDKAKEASRLTEAVAEGGPAIQRCLRGHRHAHHQKCEGFPNSSHLL